MLMKQIAAMFIFTLLIAACSSETEISSADLPEAVASAFKARYPDAADVEWEVEKEDGKQYYEAEFKLEGKEKEASFLEDGTFVEEENDD
jgi:uncharacterized lipoprotein YmbA